MQISRKSMFKASVIFSFLFLSAAITAQSSFRKLSRPEKKWVLLHPFDAKKARKITRETLITVDSIRKSGIIGSDNNGGKLDAFKHAYWMASLALEIGSKQALMLGKAHENGNYLQFKKQQQEDAVLPDSVSSLMDLRNNEAGVSLVATSKDLSRVTVQKKVLDALVNGKLTTIKKNEQGDFLTCEDIIISLKEWSGKWNIPKCLITVVYH